MVSETQEGYLWPSCYIVFYVIYEYTPQSFINFKYFMILNKTSLWDSAYIWGFSKEDTR